MLIPHSQFITPPNFGNCKFFFLSMSLLLLNRILKKMTRKIALLISHSPKVNSMTTYRCKGSRKIFSQAG